MARPRGGEWLEDEVASWSRSGVGVVVSLLTPDEVADLDLADEAELCRKRGIQFLAFPIADRTAPLSKDATLALLTKIADHLASGRNLAIHCRHGIGRAGLLGACLLILSGLDPEAAIERVSAARGCPVPETAEQRKWITDFAKVVTEHRVTRVGDVLP
jgi:protein-tyrosine phosphatase